MKQSFLVHNNTIIISDLADLPHVLPQHKWESILDLRPSFERQDLNTEQEVTHLPVQAHTLSEQDLDNARGIWSRSQGYHLVLSTTGEMPRCLIACHLGRTHQWDLKKVEQKVPCNFPRPAFQFLLSYLKRYVQEKL